MIKGLYGWRWWIFHRYSDYNVAREAIIDGSKTPAIPLKEEEKKLGPFIEELREAGGNDVKLEAKNWVKQDEAIVKDIKLRLNALNDHNTLYRHRHKTYQDCVSEYKKKHGKDPAPPNPEWKGFLYWVIIFILFILEFPFNSVVFRLFGESEIFTYIATGAIGFAIVGCAHLLGAFLKEKNTENQQLKVKIIAVLIIVPILTLLAVSLMRQLYLMSSGNEILHKTSPFLLYLAFGTFNLIIYVFASLVSYLHHEPKELKELHLAGFKLKDIRNLTLREKAKLDVLMSKREKCFQFYRTIERGLQNEVNRLIDLYWHYNIRIRKDIEAPSGQKEYPKTYPSQISYESEIDSLKKSEEQFTIPAIYQENS